MRPISKIMSIMSQLWRIVEVAKWRIKDFRKGDHGMFYHYLMLSQIKRWPYHVFPISLMAMADFFLAKGWVIAKSLSKYDIDMSTSSLSTKPVMEQPYKKINQQCKLQLNTISFLRWHHIRRESLLRVEIDPRVSRLGDKIAIHCTTDGRHVRLQTNSSINSSLGWQTDARCDWYR